MPTCSNEPSMSGSSRTGLPRRADMDAVAGKEPVTRTALEEFVRDYVETIGGAWDEVEPQVYDVLIPSEEAEARLDSGKQRILRITYDPEAIPEHPGAQLASYGTPLIARLLNDAVPRGRH